MEKRALDKVFVWGPEGGRPQFSNNRNRFTFLYGAAAIEDESAPGGLVYVMFDRTFDGCRELLRKHWQRKPERVIFFLNGNPVCEVSRSDVIGGCQ